MSTAVKVSILPPCDFCRLEGRKPTNTRTCLATYDFKTKDGPWANGCQQHYLEHRAYPDLGTEKGQKLFIDPHDPEEEKVSTTPLTDAIHEGLRKHGTLEALLSAEDLGIG